jgi:osmotically-inducible protein OsmY
MGKRWMRWQAGVPFASASGLCVLLLGVGGCNHRDADRLARVSRKAAEKVQALTTGSSNRVAEGLQVMRASWDEIALDARVAARLRWDKGLAGSHIEVRASGTTVELHGTVASANQRGRAVELAESTLGVERVSDNLELSGDQL